MFGTLWRWFWGGAGGPLPEFDEGALPDWEFVEPGRSWEMAETGNRWEFVEPGRTFEGPA